MTISQEAYTALARANDTQQSPFNDSDAGFDFPLTMSQGDLSWKERWGSLSLKFTHLVESNAGLLLVAASQFFFSLMNLVAKKVNSVDPSVPTLELILIRMGITWICCVIYMYITKVPDPILGPEGVRLLLLTRGFVGFFGLFGVYYSLQYLSLSDATVLTFLAPIATGITGALLLNETFSRKEAFAGLCSLVGVILIARPTFIFGSAGLPVDGGTGVERGTPGERLGAVGVALIGVLGATGAYTTLRAIGKRAHPLHSLVGFSTWCVIVSSIGMLATRTSIVIPHRWDFLALLLMMGIFGFVAQTLLTMGLQRETAGRGTLAVYIQIVFASILERIFFHSTPSILSTIGSLIILASALYVALTKSSSATTAPSSATVYSSAGTGGGEEILAVEEGLGLLSNADVDTGLDPSDVHHKPLEDAGKAMSVGGKMSA